MLLHVVELVNSKIVITCKTMYMKTFINVCKYMYYALSKVLTFS